MSNEEHLNRAAETASSRAEFVQFVHLLLEDFRTSGQEWENNTLESFLEALMASAADLDGYYQNFKINVDADKPSWRVFAEMLHAARVYE